jgi:hypothetical protein
VTGSRKVLVALMRRPIRTYGLAAVLDAIADVLEAAGDPALGHDAIAVRRVARRVWTKKVTDRV